ncbi:MAG: hypothetical protein HC800_10840 [Phormidesmis sp. RL_2_1]|nr:hypothetical protein [Phormidesmis sp. RL_2_1]
MTPENNCFAGSELLNSFDDHYPQNHAITLLYNNSVVSPDQVDDQASISPFAPVLSRTPAATSPRPMASRARSRAQVFTAKPSSAKVSSAKVSSAKTSREYALERIAEVVRADRHEAFSG